MVKPGFYESQLTVLTVYCIAALLVERYVDRQKRATSATPSGQDDVSRPLNAGIIGEKGSRAYALLQKNYLIVYAVVMGADWLQGPYVYSLYRDQYGYSERVVGLLFVTGFCSAGLTAPLVGVWADQYGRKRLCLYFCIAYTLSCFCIQFPFLPILFVGRLIAGFSTSILFSCFDSWLVSSSQQDGVSSADLSTIFGRATQINGFVAAAAGVISNELVATTSTFASPFILSGLLLVVSYGLIRAMWMENYGNQDAAGAKADLFQIGRIKQAWSIVRRDPSLMVLGVTQTCFEGSMYLFVFLWVPSMQESSPPNVDLPLGYIFSAFMVSMMLGSLLYTSIVSHSRPNSDPPLVLHAKLSSLVCLAASLALATSYAAATAKKRFWAFCVFEACVGMYYPVQGMLRGSMISNDHRATLSALFRVPLNVFVTGVMVTGVSTNRQLVFSGCTTILALSSVLTALVVVRRTTEMASAQARPA